MSWMKMLYDTYENCSSLIGRTETEEETMLLPIAHTTQNAHIELTIDREGNLIGKPRVITDKKDSITVIPCTEQSQSRSGSNPVNHPLFDKLQYLAGDYTEAGGEKGASFHENYMRDLQRWCASPYAHPSVCAVLSYLRKGRLIGDLVETEIIPAEENGMIIREWKKDRGEKRGVFTAGSALSDALDAFVRINVHEIGNSHEVPLWNDRTAWDSYISYTSSLQGETNLCYVQGAALPCSNMSPSKIRGTGDKAKLISSNDGSGFTYRGRFVHPSEAASVGYETTQKAHNALKWLISKQGFRIGEQVFVIWGTHGENLPPIEMDSLDLMVLALGSDEPLPDVQTEYARKVKRMMLGYSQKLTKHSQVVILGLDSATTGRLSIIRYQELWGSAFLDRLQDWYESCVWMLDYKKNPRSDKEVQYLHALGTPSPKDILFAVYGSEMPDKLKKSAMQRLMHCILDGTPIPKDFMLSAARRASNPNAMEAWEYRKTLAIACAIIRKYYSHKGDGLAVGLDYRNVGRSYLFGRVLAYYHYIEQQALRLSGEKRPTNAMRLKYQFSRKPAKTLEILDQKVQPYLAKADGRLNYLATELNKVISEIDGNNCENMTNAPLDETYLLGFSSQMTEFYTAQKGE